MTPLLILAALYATYSVFIGTQWLPAAPNTVTTALGPPRREQWAALISRSRRYITSQSLTGTLRDWR